MIKRFERLVLNPLERNCLQCIFMVYPMPPCMNISKKNVLMYEITAKMGADIHTKGFKNPMAWKKACMLINLLEPQDLQSKEALDMLQPSTDVDMTTRQVFQSKTGAIPNFPYTETPILPKEVYRKGLTSKEETKYLPGMDPIFVVKQPVFYRPFVVKQPVFFFAPSRPA